MRHGGLNMDGAYEFTVNTFLCVGPYVVVCMYACVYVCMLMWMWEFCVSPHIFVSEWAAYYLQACTCAHRLCMPVRLFVHDFVFVYVWLYRGLCSYVCAYVFISLEWLTKFMHTDPCIVLFSTIYFLIACAEGYNNLSTMVQHSEGLLKKPPPCFMCNGFVWLRWIYSPLRVWPTMLMSRGPGRGLFI